MRRIAFALLAGAAALHLHCGETDRGSESTPPTTEDAAQAVEPEAPPYRTVMDIDGREVRLRGNAPDEIDRDAVRAAFKEGIGRNVRIQNSLSLKKGAPPGWSAALQAVAIQARHFRTARVVLEDATMHVEGVVRNAEAQDTLPDTIRAGVPAEVEVSFALSLENGG